MVHSRQALSRAIMHTGQHSDLGLREDMMALLTAMKTDTASESPSQVQTVLLLIRSALEWGATCIRRSQERAELRQLGPRDRKDLGHSRVNAELGKPLWKY